MGSFFCFHFLQYGTHSSTTDAALLLVPYTNMRLTTLPSPCHGVSTCLRYFLFCYTSRLPFSLAPLLGVSACRGCLFLLYERATNHTPLLPLLGFPPLLGGILIFVYECSAHHNPISLFSGFPPIFGCIFGCTNTLPNTPPSLPLSGFPLSRVAFFASLL